MWAVERNKKNHKEINQYFNKVHKTTNLCDTGENTYLTPLRTHDYLHYPKYSRGTSRKIVSTVVEKGYTLVTLEEFILVMNKTDKKIIGYKCPVDIESGKVKKGDIFQLHVGGDKILNPFDIYVCGVQALPKEIVETWEPVYEETIKVGDYITVDKSKCPKNFWFQEVDECTFLVTEMPSAYYGGDAYTVSYLNKNFLPSSGGISVDAVRLATPEEIARIKSKNITVSFGNSNREVIIKKDRVLVGCDMQLNKDVKELWKNIINFENTQLAKQRRATVIQSMTIGCLTITRADMLAIINTINYLEKLP